LTELFLITLIYFKIFVMDLSLKGKTAVVCGSTQGIGRAIAEAFATYGARCILLARNKTSLEEVRRGLSTKDGQEHQAIAADFSELSQVRAAIAEIIEIGAVDILVNNTGGPKPGPLVDVATTDLSKAFEQHIICNQLLAQAFVPFMQKAGYGRIINIVSTSIRIPLNNLGASNTIRGAVASWAKTLANEIGEFNITVNNILPGFTQTARLDSLVQNMSANSGKSKEEVELGLKQSIPMKRFGQPEELANLAVFLASHAAAYITGTSIAVDGGKTGSI
jgi:3-oxoacyl-[acyl-carrier protein] reductase